jgi:hypothetical protein
MTLVSIMSNKTLPSLRPGRSNKGKPDSSMLKVDTRQLEPIHRQKFSLNARCGLYHNQEFKNLDNKVDIVLRKLEDLKQDLIASNTLIVGNFFLRTIHMSNLMLSRL